MKKPWSHQLKTIEACRDRENFGLFYEMGAGKTGTAVLIFKQWKERHVSIGPVLVICPVIVKENWAREFEAFWPESSEYVQVLKGPEKARIDQLNAAGKAVFITNPESLSMRKLVVAFHKKNFRGLILDESHRFKSPQSKRVKELIRLADKIRFKLLLTGTPILNSAMDLWSQFRILDKNILGDNFFVFRHKYFVDMNRSMPSHVHFPNWVPLPGMEQELNTKIYEHAHRVLKEDVLDLPPLVRQAIPVTLTPDQKRMYLQMKKSFIAYLDENDPSQASVATLALTKALRLQQIISGIFVSDERDEQGKPVTVPIKNNRIDVLREVIADVGPTAKVIIWAVFRQSYREIERMLSNYFGEGRTVLLTGDQSEREKQDAVDTFNTDPNCRFIVANPAAGGTGVNLTAASVMVYYSRNFSLEQEIQSEARAHRGGQTKKVTRVDLVSEGTIDEIIMQALANKQNLANSILEWKDKI